MNEGSSESTLVNGHHALDPEKQKVEAQGFAGWPRRPSLLNPLGLPAPLTLKQKLYVIGPQMIGAAVIDGLANFGIACAMYRTANKPITVWKLDQNTLAGDLGVTVFIQGIASFVIASGMVHVDLRLHRIDPLPYPWPDTSFGVWRVNGPEKASTRHGKLWRQFHNDHLLGRGLHFFSGSDVNDVFDFKIGFKPWLKRFVLSVWVGSVLSALYWFLFWPIAIAIVAPIWDNNPLSRDSWAPPLIKLIYGGLLGLLMNPIIALIALGSEDACRLHLREEQKARFEAADRTGPAITEAEQVPPADLVEKQMMVQTRPMEANTLVGSRPGSPVDGARPLSTDVEKLRHSLELGSRRSSPRGSLDLSRSPDGRKASLDIRRPSSPLQNQAPRKPSPIDGLSPPRPSLERRRSSPTPQPLAVEPSHASVPPAQ